ncbi:hypothetical protein D3C71_788610 [compost metagenome]
MQRAATLTKVNLRLRRDNRLTATKWRIWLADVRRTADADGQVALRYCTAIQRDFTVHDHRTGTRVDDHFGILKRDVDFHILDIGQHAHLVAATGRRADLHGAGIQRRGATKTTAAVDGVGNLLRHREVFIIQLQIDGIPGAKLRRQFTLDNRPVGNTPAIQLVHLHAAPARRCTRTADQNVTLRERIHLAIDPFQRGHQQRTAAQTFGVTHRRNDDVDGLSLARKGRVGCGNHYRCHVFQLHVGARRDGDPELGQHVVQTLSGKWRLGGLVACTVQADDQAVANQ